MSDVILRIPRQRKKVQIIKSKDLIEKELSKYLRETDLDLKALFDEKFNIDDPENQIDPNDDVIIEKEIPEINRTVFSQTFSISNSNSPTEISLKNIQAPSITLNEAMIEVQSAYDTGVKHGKETSDAEYLKELRRHEEWVRNIDILMRNIKSQFILETQKLEEIAINMAIAISKKIIDREIETDTNIVIEQAKRAIKHIGEERIIELRVNPKDLKIIKACKSILVSDDMSSSNFDLIPDSKIQEGSCKLMTGAGSIDTDFNKQLEIIKEAMQSELNTNEFKVEKLASESNLADLDNIYDEDTNEKETNDDNIFFTESDDIDLFKEY